MVWKASGGEQRDTYVNFRGLDYILSPLEAEDPNFHKDRVQAGGTLGIQDNLCTVLYNLSQQDSWSPPMEEELREARWLSKALSKFLSQCENHSGIAKINSLLGPSL